MKSEKLIKGTEEFKAFKAMPEDERKRFGNGLAQLATRISRPTTVDITNVLMYNKPVVVLLFPYPYDEEFNFLDCEEYQVPDHVDLIGVFAKDQFFIVPAGQWIDHATKRLAELSEEE